VHLADTTHAISKWPAWSVFLTQLQADVWPLHLCPEQSSSLTNTCGGRRKEKRR
jgi:hypothetical protein